MIPIPLDFIRPIAAIAAAGSFWMADTTITPEVPGVPAWITALGLPIAFLVAVIYALVTVNRAYRDSVNGRLTDKDALIAKLETFHDKDIESRAQLTIATTAQAVAQTRTGEILTSLEKAISKCPASK
jgi:hypothetical protein